MSVFVSTSGIGMTTSFPLLCFPFVFSSFPSPTPPCSNHSHNTNLNNNHNNHNNHNHREVSALSALSLSATLCLSDCYYCLSVMFLLHFSLTLVCLVLCWCCRE